MTTKKIARPSRPPIDRMAVEYLKTRGMREEVAKREDKLKKMVLDSMADALEPTDDGHIFLYLEDPIGPYTGIKREVRRPQTLDTDAAIELAKAKGLEQRCMREVTVVEFDESALLAANFEGLISDDEIRALYTTKEIVACVPIKEAS